MAAELKAKLGLDVSEYARGAGEAVAANFSIAKGLDHIKGLMVSAFSVAALEGAVERMAELNKELRLLKEETGLGTVQAQTWKMLFSKFNVDESRLPLMFSKINEAREKALTNPASPEAKAFAHFGIAQGALGGMLPADIVTALSARMTSKDRGFRDVSALGDLIGLRMATTMHGPLSYGTARAEREFADRVMAPEALASSEAAVKTQKRLKDRLSSWVADSIQEVFGPVDLNRLGRRGYGPIGQLAQTVKFGLGYMEDTAGEAAFNEAKERLAKREERRAGVIEGQRKMEEYLRKIEENTRGTKDRITGTGEQIPME